MVSRVSGHSRCSVHRRGYGGQEPCRLCWYQRIAMFPLAIVLGVACLTDDFLVWRYALPLSIVGFSIALWHSLLYAGIVPEPIVPCSQTGPSCTSADMLLFNTLPLPYLSLICFTLILICLLYTSPSPRDRTRSRMPSSA